MHYEIAFWLVGSWSCSGRHNNFSVYIWSVDVVKPTPLYNDYREMKTLRQACTLSDTAKKTKGQRCPSNLCTVHTQQLTHPRAGEVIEIESGEEEDAQREVSCAETLALCQRLDGKEPASGSETPTPHFHLTC